MPKKTSKCIAKVISPIAQGLYELSMGRIGTIKSTLQDHFRTNDVLPKAIEESFNKALASLEIAMAGPRLYNKTSIRDFSENFHQQILRNFLQSHGFDEEKFLKQCLHDLKVVKKHNLFGATDIPSDLAEQVGLYASQDVSQLQQLENEAQNSFSEVVFELTAAPHALAMLLKEHDVISEAAAMHFGMAIKKDEYLFRAFFIAQQQGIKKQLAQIAQQLQQGHHDGQLVEQKKMLEKVQSEVQGGLKYISQDVQNKLDENFQRFDAHFGTINTHLTELRAVGEEVIEQLGSLDQQVSDIHTLLREIHSEIHNLKPGSPQAVSEITCDSHFHAQGQFARYRIIKQIGQGGMGKVYQAHDPELDREVALKVVLGHNEKKSVERFIREAKAMAQLRHPNIARIYDFGQQQQQLFFTMDFIKGGSLKDQYSHSKFTFDEIIHMVIKIGKAISYAHQQGIIHRDLKLANILLDNDNEPIVTDFGLAKAMHSESDLTQEGAIIGTLAYMSPEQANGEKVDIQSDVYSLGAILYKLISGRLPFVGESSFTVLRQILQNEPPSLRDMRSDVPQELERICLKALHKDRNLRYSNANDMVVDLQKFTQRSNKKILLVAAVVLLFAGAIIGALSWQNSSTNSVDTSGLIAQGWPQELLDKCWDKTWMDFTVSAWNKLSAQQQGTYSKIYQHWYAATIAEVEVETKVKINACEFTLVLIPPGKFLMGSPQQEKYREAEEGPQHTVVISKPLWLGKTEITHQQWKAILRHNPSHFQKAGDDAAVENIFWEDANIFCRRLSEKAPENALSFRLPSEAEWEYACRAGTLGMSYIGDFEIQGEKHAPQLDKIAWYGGNSEAMYEGAQDSSLWIEKQYPMRTSGTQPVGKKQQNPWGLHDMLGNVGEWCSDYYGNYSLEEKTDPQNEAITLERIFRGGSWGQNAYECRAAYRCWTAPQEYQSPYTGLRIAANLQK